LYSVAWAGNMNSSYPPLTLKDMIRNRPKQTLSHATEDLMTM